jgi:hypothetical protein
MQTVRIVTNLSEQSIQQHAELQVRLATNAKREVDRGEPDMMAAASLADVSEQGIAHWAKLREMCDQGIARWDAVRQYARSFLPPDEDEPEPRPAAMVPPVHAVTARN